MKNGSWRSIEPLKNVVIVMCECVTQYVAGWAGNGDFQVQTLCRQIYATDKRDGIKTFCLEGKTL